MFQNYRKSRKIDVDINEYVNVGETLVNYSTKYNTIDSYCVKLENDSKNDSYSRQQWSVYELDSQSRRIIRTYHTEHIEMLFNPWTNEILDKEKTEELVKRLDEIYKYQSWTDDFWNRYKYLRSSQDW